MGFKPLSFDQNLLNLNHNDTTCVLKLSERLEENTKKRINNCSPFDLVQDYLTIIRCIDLTSLTGNETKSSILKLCFRALNPIKKPILDELVKQKYLNNYQNLTVAGFCCYPNYLSYCIDTLKFKEENNVKLVVTSTGFPSGQLSDIKIKCKEIYYAIKLGAEEVDVVINRTLVLQKNWKKIYDEIFLMRNACKNVKLKVILEVGELHDLNTVFEASMVAMNAGADMIKTSTGKTNNNATIPFGLVMIRAIKLFYLKTGRKVGLKAAGGIKTELDAMKWITLVRYYLGDCWLNKKYFRIGASSLLSSIEINIFKLLYKRDPKKTEINL